MTILVAKYTSGKISVPGDGATTFTLASWPLATLTQHIATGAILCLQIRVAMFSQLGYGSTLGQTVIFLDKQSGPTYNLGAVKNTLLSARDDAMSGGYVAAVSADQNSGNLRLRGVFTSTSCDIWAIAECIGQV